MIEDKQKVIKCKRERCLVFKGVHKMAPELAVCGDMGWGPCEIRQKGDMLLLWNRLINMPANRLTILHKSFIGIGQITIHGQENWESYSLNLVIMVLYK